MELAISIPSSQKLHYIDNWADVSPKNRVKSLFELVRNRYHQLVVKACEKRDPKIELTHVYFGNEFCQKLIPTADEVAEAYKLVTDKGLIFSLVTPYVTNEGLQKLESVLPILNGQSVNTEVIVNDYGVLELIRKEYPNLIPVLGRIMDKQDREPRYSEAQRTDVKNQPMGRQTQYSVPVYNAFLKASGVRRVEFDNGPSFRSIDLTQLGLGVSVYVPYGYITTGRICMMGAIHQPVGKKFRANGRCAKECQLFSSLLYNPRLSKEQKLIGRGNTVFFFNDMSQLNDLIKNGENLGVDRVVFQPEIPM